MYLFLDSIRIKKGKNADIDALKRLKSSKECKLTKQKQILTKQKHEKKEMFIC